MNADCSCVIDTLRVASFSSRSIEEKNSILRAGRPTPDLPELVTKTKFCVRQFSTGHYQLTPWLTGCKGVNKLFCWPCILFSTEQGPWQKGGYSDLNNFTKAVSRHETCQKHLQAVVDLKVFGNVRIDFQIDNQRRLAIHKHNETVKRNRLIIERLIRVTCHLGVHELAFRGHDEASDSDNRGNYVDSVQLLGEYDDLLSQHLTEATVFSGLSNRIQNDLIASIGFVMLEDIKAEIKGAAFIAISLDEATDVRNLSQLSAVFRYVGKRGEVLERFIEFTDVSSDRAAPALASYVFSLLDTYDCTTKLVAQTYDGASVMSGHLSGLQARVKERCPEALFVHCVAHRLNLVLSQALQNYNISECKVFFKTLGGFAAFFSKSTKRTETLDREVKKRFPSVCPTRWSYNGRLVETLYEYRKELIAMFEGMLNDPDNWDSETFNMARGYLAFLEGFDANFMLAIFSELFALTDSVFQIIQSKANDITFCLRSISELKENLLEKRNEFDRFWTKATEMSPNPPANRRKRLPNVEVEGSYRRLFFEIVDNLVQQIATRFDDVAQMSFLELIDSKKSHSYSKNFPAIAFDSLKKSYGKFFDFPRLRTELIYLYCSEQMKDKDVAHLRKFIFDRDLVSAFPQLAKLCTLVLTIPATSVSVERSFSALKRIKTYIRNSTGQARLSRLALMSIEKHTLITFLKPENRARFYERVIEDFVKTSRRMELIFK
jgi:hypothetical protein